MVYDVPNRLLSRVLTDSTVVHHKRSIAMDQNFSANHGSVLLARRHPTDNGTPHIKKTTPLLGATPIFHAYLALAMWSCLRKGALSDTSVLSSHHYAALTKTGVGAQIGTGPGKV